MKKIITTLSFPLMLASVTAHATHNGPYAGLGIGVQNYLPKTTFIEEDREDITRSSLSQGTDALSGHILLGYSKPLNARFSMALQADAHLTNPRADIFEWTFDKEDNASSTGLIRRKYKNSFGINLRPIYNVNETAHVYGILGYRYANTSFHLTASEANGNFSRNFNHNGIEYGLGVEIDLKPSLALRLEVSQTNYASRSVITPPTDAGETGSISSKFKVNQGVLALVYYPDWAGIK